MIPTKKEDIKITSTIEGESIKMRIDEDATEHIISLLTDLYSDPEMAIVREVSTNALDSHVAAGQTRPIEVTTPTALSPVFKVQDWGLGLNADDIRNVYSLYGRSTKTDTNEQTGSLGLGCKSPLTYTNQFSVIGVKDGIKTSAMVTRDEDGIPTIEIMPTSPTDEPNGLTVVITAKRANSLHSKAQEVFRFWPEGTVLLNGESPKRLEGLTISDNFLLCDNGYGWPDSCVVMGNVAYPVERDYFGSMDLDYTQFVICRVPNGSVHFTPSREALQYTKRTKRVLEGLCETFGNEIVIAAQKDIDDAPTRHEGLRRAVSWNHRIPRTHKSNVAFTYHNEEIPTEIECPGSEGALFELTSGRRNDGKMGSSSHAKKVKYVTVPYALWVYGFSRGFTATVKKRLWLYCDQNNLPYPEQFILSTKRVRSKWIDKDRMIDWEQVAQIKIPRTGIAGTTLYGRLAGSYDLFDVAGSKSEVPADQIDTTNPIYYAESSDTARNWHHRFNKLGVLDGYSIIVLYPNRIAKFMRMFPDTKRAGSVYEEFFATWWETLDLTTKDALMIKRSHASGLTKLSAAQIKDPDLVRAIRAARLDTGREDATLELFGYGRHYSALPHKWSNPLTRYPLFEDSHYDHDATQLRLHNTIYINAAFKELYANAQES